MFLERLTSDLNRALMIAVVEATERGSGEIELSDLIFAALRSAEGQALLIELDIDFQSVLRRNDRVGESFDEWMNQFFQAHGDDEWSVEKLLDEQEWVVSGPANTLVPVSAEMTDVFNDALRRSQDTARDVGAADVIASAMVVSPSFVRALLGSNDLDADAVQETLARLIEDGIL